MSYVGVFGLKISGVARPRLSLTICDHLVNYCGRRLQKIEIKLFWGVKAELSRRVWSQNDHWDQD